MRSITLITVLIGAASVSCTSQASETFRAAEAHSPAASPDRVIDATPDVQQVIDRVRRATARYQDLENALADGWTDQYPEGCAESPDGAQAYHYLNRALVDDTLDLLRPELFMYERQEDGSMELVGVDYIIPFDQWEGAEPPTLVGQPLGRNEPLGVWAIHIWAWRSNPSGTFAPWNPSVSCAYAD